MSSLEGKVAVITGGYGILCAPIAENLALIGNAIAILGRRLDKAEELATKINNKGGRAIGLCCDVTNKESLITAKEQILKEFGTIDILINGAGGNKVEATTSEERSFFNIPEEAIKEVFDLNFMGTVLATQVFGEIFVQKKSGCIINITSMAAFKPLTRTIAYSAAKAAVSNFTQWMAVHFNQLYSPAIRVNAIAPGFFLTEQNRYLLVNPDTGKPTERGKKIIQLTPMGRYGDPHDIAGIVQFLCSEEASFINGCIIPIDGGFSAYSGV